MAGRPFGSGFSNWGGGSSSRDTGDYDLYGGSGSGSGPGPGPGPMSGRSGFGSEGYGGGGGQMNRCPSGDSFLSPSLSDADDMITKINQRLDVLAQLEGSLKGRGGGDRFDQYESFDSHSSALGTHDPYRSDNFGHGDSWGEMVAQRGGVGFGAMGGPRDGGDFASFGSHKTWQTRDAFPGSGWGAGQRSPCMDGAPGAYGFGGRQDSFSGGGGGGRNGGQDKPPSLLAYRVFPKRGAFQPQRGPQDYPDRHFGGGRRANQQRSRKDPLKQQGRPQHGGQKKRKQSGTAVDDPDSKRNKTETDWDKSDDADPAELEDTKGTEDPATASETAAEGKSDALSINEELTQLKEKLQESQATPSAQSDNEAADQAEECKEAESPSTSSKHEAEGQSAMSIEEELCQLKAKLQGKDPSEIKVAKRRGYFEMSGMKITARRVSFVCSVCKFRTFYKEDMDKHLESQFHKNVFKFLSSRLSKRTMDFLQEYLDIKLKNTEKTISGIMNHSAAVCQLYREQDLTRDIEMEHFMKKVEAAHCAACDLYIPMQPSLLQRHIRSPDHNYNRKHMMEEFKKSGLLVARSILNHKPVRQKLEKYLKGENPFAMDDQDMEDVGADAPEADENEEVNEQEAEPAGTGEALEKQEEREEGEPQEVEAKQESEVKQVDGEGEEEVAGDEKGEEEAGEEVAGDQKGEEVEGDQKGEEVEGDEKGEEKVEEGPGAL